MSRVRDLFKWVTGFSTPFGGISWSPPTEDEKGNLPLPGFKRLRAAVIYQGRVTLVEPVDLPIQILWQQGVCALCVAAEAPQDPEQYRLLDIHGGAWLKQPATSGDLKVDWIAVVHKDFAEQFRNDAQAIAEIVKIRRRQV